MLQSSANCLCGKVLLKLYLPKPIEDYTPRLCDCDFCTKRHISYLSDPAGMLEVCGASHLESLTQGYEQALFWQCKVCRSLIVVTCDFEDEVKGAVNSTLFTTNYTLANALVTSPKRLSSEVKRERWQALWLQVYFSV